MTEAFRQHPTWVLVLFALSIPLDPCVAQSRISFSLPFGPWTVGFRSVVLIDSTRTIPAVDSAGERQVPGRLRPLQVSVWYPAVESPDAQPMKYRDYVGLFSKPLTTPTNSAGGGLEAEQEFLSYGHLLLLARRGEQGWMNRRRTALQEAGSREFDVATHAIRDASPADGPFPVVIYGPGAGGPSFENDVLMEYLASNGYIVVASPSWGPLGPTRIDRLGLEEHVRDFEFLTAYARGLRQASTGGVALIGFSWGGLANVVAASRNSNVAAVVTLDGSIRYFSSQDYVRNALDQVLPFTTPTLFIEQGANTDTAFFRLARADTTNYFFRELRYADAVRAVMRKLDHQNFVAMYNRFSGDQPVGFVSDPSIFNDGYEKVCLLTLHFLNAYLQTDSASMSVLSGNTAQELGLGENDATIERKRALRPLPTVTSFAAAARERGVHNALALMREIRRSDPTYSIPEAEMSNWAWSQRGDSIRLAAFQTLVEMHPESIGANSDLGDAYLAVGDTAQAISSFERVLSIDPQSQYAQEMLQRLRTDTSQAAAWVPGSSFRMQRVGRSHQRPTHVI